MATLAALWTGCDPTTYINQKHNFTSKWQVSKVVAPSYPFDKANATNTIDLSFPKQGEFLLHLSVNSCGGTYEANPEGYISFTRTSCTEQCCDSEWEYYILTLIRKASRYDGGEDGQPLYLYMDKKNYIVLEQAN